VGGVTTLSNHVQINGDLATTGTRTASNSNPSWVAGKVNGGGLITVLSDIGRVILYVTRPAGQPVGVYKISWDELPRPRGSEYVIQLTSQITGFTKVLFVPAPNSTSFHNAIYNTSGAPANEMFYFTVLA
jgi:hypothetical protein